MKRYLTVVCLIIYSVLALAPAGSASAETLTLNSAINKAGRQRMLSQRMAKAYCQIGLGVEVERAKRILDQSVALFDKQLTDLQAFAPTSEIKDTYASLDQAWIAYKKLISSSEPNLEKVKTIARMSEEVLKLAQQGTVQLERLSGTPTAKLINVAGRQRMLSQRIAAISMLRAWGITSPRISQDLDNATAEFAAAQELLTSAPQNTPSIRGELMLAGSQWLFFKEALSESGVSRAEQLRNIASTSERILQTMDEVTGMYERLLK